MEIKLGLVVGILMKFDSLSLKSKEHTTTSLPNLHPCSNVHGSFKELALETGREVEKVYALLYNKWSEYSRFYYYYRGERKSKIIIVKGVI